MKTGLNKNETFARLPIQVAKAFNGNEYKFYDYLLYRFQLEGWKFYISDIVTETGSSKSTVLRLCREGKERGFLSQDIYGHYHLEYNKLHAFIWDTINSSEQVSNCYQVGVKMIPAGVKLTPEQVSKNNHTRMNTSNKKKNEYISNKDIGNESIKSTDDTAFWDNLGNQLKAINSGNKQIADYQNIEAIKKFGGN